MPVCLKDDKAGSRGQDCSKPGKKVCLNLSAKGSQLKACAGKQSDAVSSDQDSDSDTILSGSSSAMSEDEGSDSSEEETTSSSGDDSSDGDDYSRASVSGSDDDELEDRKHSHSKATSSKSLRHMITDKAIVQQNERIDLAIPSKFPQKPMVELAVGSNIWYQAYFIRESANEAKLRFPGVSASNKDRVEWIKKGSSRIWRGSLSSSAWKHLGKGAWAPRKEPSRSRRGAQARRHKRQHWSKRGRKSESPDETTEINTQSTHPGTENMAEDEVMSPRPRPAQTSGTQAGLDRHMDEQLSDREHGSTHSPNVAESPCPGVFADVGSARDSPSEELAGSVPFMGDEVDVQVVDPNYDPLAKWFEVHFHFLHTAGTLAALPFGTPESGILPSGFSLDPLSKQIVQSQASKAAAAKQSAAAAGPSEPAAGAGSKQQRSRKRACPDESDRSEDTSNMNGSKQQQQAVVDGATARAPQASRDTAGPGPSAASAPAPSHARRQSEADSIAEKAADKQGGGAAGPGPGSAHPPAATTGKKLKAKRNLILSSSDDADDDYERAMGSPDRGAPTMLQVSAPGSDDAAPGGSGSCAASPRQSPVADRFRGIKEKELSRHPSMGAPKGPVAALQGDAVVAAAPSSSSGRPGSGSSNGRLTDTPPASKLAKVAQVSSKSGQIDSSKLANRPLGQSGTSRPSSASLSEPKKASSACAAPGGSAASASATVVKRDDKPRPEPMSKNKYSGPVLTQDDFDL